MSFMLTTQAMYQRRKTVTRRDGWWNLKAGEIVMAVEKCQGLKKGEKVVKMYPIRILSTRPEPLNAITDAECVLEGFPEMQAGDFVDMFTKHNKCEPEKVVNRIEFEEVTEPLERMNSSRPSLELVEVG